VAALVLVVLLVLWKLAGHFLGAAALLVVIAVVAAGVAVAAAFALAAFLSTRRRRARADDSPSLRYGVTEAPRRLRPVTTPDRGLVPRWPDRPMYRAAPAGHAEQQERVGSAV
jgi:hypothetical protein